MPGLADLSPREAEARRAQAFFRALANRGVARWRDFGLALDWPDYLAAARSVRFDTSAMWAERWQRWSRNQPGCPIAMAGARPRLYWRAISGRSRRCWRPARPVMSARIPRSGSAVTRWRRRRTLVVFVPGQPSHQPGSGRLGISDAGLTLRKASGRAPRNARYRRPPITGRFRSRERAVFPVGAQVMMVIRV